MKRIFLAAALVLCPSTPPAPADIYGFTNWLNGCGPSTASGRRVRPEPRELGPAEQHPPAEPGDRALRDGPGPPAEQCDGQLRGDRAHVAGVAGPPCGALLDPTIRYIGIAGYGAYWTFSRTDVFSLIHITTYRHGADMAATRTENRREFLQLAHVFDPSKHTIAGWFMSEKLDGMRCFWDGGITRGMFARDVPFANVAKDDRYISSPRSPRACGRGTASPSRPPCGGSTRCPPSRWTAS